MRSSLSLYLAALVLTGSLASQAAGQTIVNVSGNITTSTTWTANNVYNLTEQIYVKPGATLTIEAGTVIASATNVGGSLAVTRGAKIYALGTQRNPIIFTSSADRATWTNNDPKTGVWREAMNEWGNLTIMGRGYISENAVAGNVPTPNPANVAPMEGLVAQFPGDPDVLYGGGDDDDDSGALRFVSIRYGGRVIGLGNELNGLSLGGIGRETDLSHIEIMNNVDDGIEIWGGTVNIKYFSIWNIGDDSFDLDQGWRGKAQFGLIVQGYSGDAPSGSGVCDNCIEVDGAEDSDWQPVTTVTLYNMTIIGQPVGGDHAVAFRDNAKLQLRNSVIMDLGQRLVQFDNVDGDGGSGYGHNGTLSWADHWTTPYTYTSPVNAPANPAAFYTAQTSGMLCEITDSVFYNNNNAQAYTEATNRGVLDPSKNNVVEPANSPIAAITRAAPVVKGGRVMQRVTFLDPRPANEALTSVSWAPQDGFFSSSRFRGAFRPGVSWLTGWTASEAFGMTPASPWADLGKSFSGANGEPVLAATGTLASGTSYSLTLKNGPPNALAILGVGAVRWDAPFFGATVVPDINAAAGGFYLQLFTNAQGEITLPGIWPAGVPSNVTTYVQYLLADSNAPGGFAMSNAISGTTP